MTASGFTSQGTMVRKNLFASDFPRIDRKLTLVNGAGALVRGTVLGRITASGKLITSLSAAVDGSETPRFILAEDADSSGGDVECLVYETGHFLADELTIGAAHTAASIRDGLRALGIHI